MGVPASSHEIYPSSTSGVDGVEPATGTSFESLRRKMKVLGRGGDGASGSANTAVS